MGVEHSFARGRPSPGADCPLGDFRTERGAVVPRALLHYRVLGDPGRGHAAGWTMLFHDLLGSADADVWWSEAVGSGRTIDPAVRPVLVPNLLGSCFGSTGPAGPGAVPHPFPDLTPTDLARSAAAVVERLEIGRIALAAGIGLGGMVALEWGRRSPVPVDHLVVIAAPAASSPQTIAWHAAQRLAIEAHPGGLAAAHALTVALARSPSELLARFGRLRSAHGEFAVERFLRREARAALARFAPESYLTLLRAMDLHDLGDLAEAARETRARVGRVTGVGLSTDFMVPPAEVRAWVRAYRAAGVPAAYHELASIHGHDAATLDADQLAPILATPGSSPAHEPGSRAGDGSAPFP